jgi:hypothetical protein
MGVSFEAPGGEGKSNALRSTNDVLGQLHGEDTMGTTSRSLWGWDFQLVVLEKQDRGAIK